MELGRELTLSAVADISPPPIVSHQGDTVVVHATNGLGTGEGTALHTHGQFFNGSTWYDGAVSTTQCPIPPGETLDYHIDTSLQTGTYWYVTCSGYSQAKLTNQDSRPSQGPVHRWPPSS